MTAPAPLFAEVADGPPGGRAAWVRAGDGVQLRVGVWPGGRNGTVLLFPGRTEYIEKYGRAAGEFAARGFGTVVIDWRGQGLSNRPLDDPNVGHVLHFRDYQMDVAALQDFVTAQDIPGPYYLVAHSMGGAIGLAALYERLRVNAAVFTGPMWGIAISPAVRPVAWVLSWGAQMMKFGHLYAPGGKAVTYVEEADFPDNLLTRDPEMYGWMRRQAEAHPELSLGGPSMNWVHEALAETRRLARLPSPDVPTLTYLGGNERIVDPQPIHQRMAHWPRGRLEVLEGAEHEVMMERPQTRARVFDGAEALFLAFPQAG